MSDINENDEKLEARALTEPAAKSEAADQVVEAADGDDAITEPLTGEVAGEKGGQAAASDAPVSAAPAPAHAQASAPVVTSPATKSTVGLPVFIAAVAAAAVVGVLAGHFLLGSSSISLNGTTSISADKLDSAIATYTYKGTTSEITPREVITASSSLENAADSDGNYAVPSATNVLSYARNQVVLADAAARGITVTDEEVDAYAENFAGSTDYASIATQYGMDEDATKETFKSSAIMSKLRDTVCGTIDATVPTAPTAPADDATDTPTAEYASYIIELAGDEWDSANNTWASTDGDYYSALSTYEISNDSATYAAAQAAYYVAYSKYSTAASQVRSDFNTYCNELLSNATLQLGSLTL